MTDRPVHAASAPASGGRSGTYKRHRLQLAGGGTLAMTADGTIVHEDAQGSAAGSWSPGDPAWPGYAIRFGVRLQSPTTTPQGRRVPGSKPPV